MKKIVVTKKRVAMYDEDKVVQRFEGAREAAEYFRIKERVVQNCCKNDKFWRGFKFKYEEPVIAGEIWKVHPEGLEVSNLGRVKITRGITHGYFDSAGYRCVVQGTKRRKVHRLVLEAFDPVHEKLYVDHINRIKDDNRLTNLRWVTPAENSKNCKPREHFRHCVTCSCSNIYDLP